MLQLPKRFHPDFSQPKVKPKGPVEIDYSVAPKGTRVWLNNSQALSGGAFTKTGDAYYKDDYFNFDGSGDYLDCGSDPIFQSEDFTLIAVCSDFVNVSSGSICGQGGSSPSQGWTLRYDQYATANKVGFTKFGVSDGQSSITCPFATPNVVIALTFSGNNAIMCVDGAVSTVSFAAPINAQTSPKFVIGGAWRTGSFISDGGFKLHMLAAIPKNVSTARLVALAANPYNLLKPANDTWFFPVSAAGGSVDVSSTDMLLNAILDTHIITLTKDLVSNNLTVTPSLATHPVTLERTVVVEDLLLTPSLGSSALTLSRTVNNDPLTVTPILSQSAMTQTVGAGSNDMTLVPSLESSTFTVPSAVTFDISHSSYTGKSFSIAAQESTPAGLAFSKYGDKMYVTGIVTGRVYQYELPTEWDLNTAIYSGKSFDVTAQETLPNSVEFSSSGLAMYVVGTGSDTVYQYTLTTAWDVSTASYSSKSFSVVAQDASPRSLAFSSDGTTMFMVGDSSDTVWQYTLGTAWDVSTASYASKSFSVTAQETAPHSVEFSADGTLMFILGFTGDSVFQYELSTAWDVSTASYNGKSFYVGAQDTRPTELAFNAGCTAMYVVGLTTDTVYQYDLNTVSVVSSDMVLSTLLDSSSISLTHSVTHNDLSLVTALDSSAMSLVINTLSSDMLVTPILQTSMFSNGSSYGSADMQLNLQLSSHSITTVVEALNSNVIVPTFLESTDIFQTVLANNEDMQLQPILTSSAFWKDTETVSDIAIKKIRLRSSTIRYKIKQVTINHRIIED